MCADFAVCLSDKSGTKLRMSVEQWRNDTDRKKAKYSEKTLFQCKLVRHETQIGGLRVERQVTNRLSRGTTLYGLNILHILGKQKCILVTKTAWLLLLQQ